MVDTQVLIKLLADARPAQGAFEAVQRASAATAASINKVAQEGRKASASVAEIGSASRREFDLAKRSLESLIRERAAYLDLLEDELKLEQKLSAAAQQSQSARTSSSASLSGSTLQSVGRLAGIAGISGASGVGQAASQTVSGLQGLKDLGDSVKQLVADAAAGVGPLGKLSGAIQSALPAIGGIGAGIAAVGVTAGIVGVSLVALSGVLEQIRIAGERSAEAARGFLEVRDTLREIRDETLTTAEVEERLAAARQRAQDAQNDLLTNQRVLDEAFAASAEQLGDFGARIGRALAGDQGAFGVLAKDTERARAALQEANAEIAAYERALRDGTAASNDAKAEEERLAQVREAAAQKLEALAKQEADLISAFEENQRQRQEDFQRQLQRESILGSVRERRAQEDLASAQAQQQTQLQKRLADIAASGSNALAQIEDARLQKQVDTAASILDIQRKLNESLQKAAADFRAQELRQIENFQRQRERRELDARQAIDRAVQNNSVTAFLEARAQRIRERREAQEDFELQSQRRQEDFNKAQSEREQAAQERILVLQADLAAFTEAQQQKSAIERSTIQERQQAEIAAFNEQQAREQQARELRAQREAEDAALRKQFQDEDRAIAEERAEAALQRQLARIDEERAKQLASIGEVGQAAVTARQQELALLGQIISASQSALASAQTLNAQRSTTTLNAGSIPNANVGTFSGIAAIANALKLPIAGIFDNGGVVNTASTPAIGLFGRKEREFIMTERQMNAARRGAGGVSISVTIPSVNVGSVVSEAEARRIAQTIAFAAGEDVLRVVQEAIRATDSGGRR
jgi:hypothetical protein